MSDLWRPSAPLHDSVEAFALDDLTDAPTTDPDPWSTPVNTADPLDQAAEDLRAARSDLEAAARDLKAALDRIEAQLDPGNAAVVYVRDEHPAARTVRALGALVDRLDSARLLAIAAGVLSALAVMALLMALAGCSSEPTIRLDSAPAGAGIGATAPALPTSSSGSNGEATTKQLLPDSAPGARGFADVGEPEQPTTTTAEASTAAAAPTTTSSPATGEGTPSTGPSTDPWTNPAPPATTDSPTTVQAAQEPPSAEPTTTPTPDSPSTPASAPADPDPTPAPTPAMATLDGAEHPACPGGDLKACGIPDGQQAIGCPSGYLPDCSGPAPTTATTPPGPTATRRT